MAAPEAPLRFHNPPGWPPPSAAWVAEHQGWQPPPKWTPVPGAPRAPHNWAFWEPNARAWAAASERFTAAGKATAAVGWSIVGVSLGLIAAAWISLSLVLAIVGCCALAIGLIVAVSGHASVRRGNKRAYLAIVIAARGARSTGFHEHYLAA